MNKVESIKGEKRRERHVTHDRHNVLRQREKDEDRKNVLTLSS